jgi:hypothetical protein
MTYEQGRKLVGLVLIIVLLFFTCNLFGKIINGYRDTYYRIKHDTILIKALTDTMQRRDHRIFEALTKFDEQLRKRGLLDHNKTVATPPVIQANMSQSQNPVLAPTSQRDKQLEESAKKHNQILGIDFTSFGTILHFLIINGIIQILNIIFFLGLSGFITLKQLNKIFPKTNKEVVDVI